MKGRRLFSSVISFLMIFFFTCFVTTCSIMLFQETLMSTLGYEFSQTEIEKSAVLTFANVIFITLFFSAVFEIRRHFTVTRPMRKIQECLEKLREGDYTARIDKRKLHVTSEFSEIAEDINSLAKELNGVEILRNDFISNVSHEIKTPLSIIQNYSILLSTPGLSEGKRMEYANVISHRCRKLALMVSDILKLNKLANQDIYPDVNEFDLSEEICSCLLSFEERWTQKEIILSADIEEGIMFTSDSSLLDIMWSNLFSNAFKFTPEGGSVSIRAKLYGDKAMIMVKDSGCGMSEDQLAHIWDKFYQCDPSSPEGGNGLGLPMVRRVIEIIHGEIDVKSTPGKGSTFTVTLPGCRKG